VNARFKFLLVDDVVVLHAFAIEDQGGDRHIRDRGLLESAVAAPAQSFAGELRHVDVAAIASAYLFHICSNHPFVDGNKRAATAAMLAFLSDNGWRLNATADETEPIVLQVASGSLDKQSLTDWVRKHISEK
jgi:death on curing protein